MKQILETNRLILRELCPDDAEAFYSLNLNPNVLKYTGDTAFKDREDARRFLENYQDYRLNGYGRWAVIHKETNACLGWCGLKYGGMENETDIGFRFFEEEWNKGYATESVIACINYGLNELKLKRIIGRAMKENMGSIKVLEKAGLKYEKDVDFEGENAVIYAVEK